VLSKPQATHSHRRYRVNVRRPLFVIAGVIVLASLGVMLRASATAARTGVAVRVAAAVAGPPRSIAAAGDSFNTGFAARPSSGDNPDLSWSTGDDPRVKSIYDRLLPLSPGIRGRRLLVAVDGSKVSDLPKQFDRAAAFHAQLITIQSGGNDVCDARDESATTSATEFRASVEQAFAIARQRLPDARIFVTSLTDEARWNDQSATIPGNASKLSDGTLCDPILDASGAPSSLRRSQIQAAEQRYNAILRDVCMGDPHCRYDGGAFFRLEYDRADIAPTDAFHPSLTGLTRMAATAWRAGFDFRDVTAPSVSASTKRVGSTFRVALRASDAAGIAGFECRFDSAPYATCRSRLVLAQGARVTYRAVDRNGNSSAAYSIEAP
jgi:lysophospholipase L1-like esterase